MGLEKLIKKCKKNDIKAQEELYRLYAGKFFGLCLKYSSGYHEAEDNLQDGFINIFSKISQYQERGSFEGWMKRIIINTSLQKHRKNRFFEVINEELVEGEVMVEADTEDIQLDVLLEHVQELPERYRQVFNLYVLDGYSHKEVAEMLNISEGTSKSNLARARYILKNKIEKEYNQSSAQSL